MARSEPEPELTAELGERLGASAAARDRALCTVVTDRRMTLGEFDPNAVLMQGNVKIDGDLSKVLAVTSATWGPSYKDVQERIRMVTEF